jgi:hypothetical protein
VTHIKETFDRVRKPLSTAALRVIHDEIRRLLAEDDAIPEYAGKRHGVRKHPEFKAESDVIERILTNREVKFDPIPW